MISRKSLQALVLATAGVLALGARCGSNKTDNTGASGSRNAPTTSPSDTNQQQDQSGTNTAPSNSGTAPDSSTPGSSTTTP